MRIHPSHHPMLLAASATALILVLAAAPAHAGYSVATNATSGNGYLRGCAAIYNQAYGPGAHFLVTDGLGTTPCPTSGSDLGGGRTWTYSGTTDKTGTLKSSVDRSATVAPGYGTGSAYAAADLRTASVHLSATSTEAGGNAGAQAEAIASFSDTLHFRIAGANANTVTLVPVHFDFDGKLTHISNIGYPSGTLGFGFGFGAASIYTFGHASTSRDNPTLDYNGDIRAVGWQSYSINNDPLNTVFNGVYAIQGSSADIAVGFGLDIGADDFTLDYSNTGKVSIGHVAGVTYTSDSGVFAIGGGSTNVPEPAALALLGLGAAGLAVARRRGR